MGYLDGFGVVIKKWFGVTSDTGARITTQYPEETRPKPERFHGRHVLNRYEDGMEKCIGCELCAGVCPARCIYVRGEDNDPADPTSPGERFGFIYEINYLRCIHCDLCVEACPTEAITETKLFEFAFTNRADAIYTRAELLVDDDGRPQQLPWENWDGGFDAARDSSGWMRATSPSGDAEFEGIVAWAGELGYGVRSPERTTIDAGSGPVPSGADHGHDDHDHDHAGPAEGVEAGDHPPRPAGLFDAPNLAVSSPGSSRRRAKSMTETSTGNSFDPAPEDVVDPAIGEPSAPAATGGVGGVDGPPSTTSAPGFFDAPDEPAPKKRRFGR